jgi:hypothetical protein
MRPIGAQLFRFPPSNGFAITCSRHGTTGTHQLGAQPLAASPTFQEDSRQFIAEFGGDVSASRTVRR